MWKVHRNTIYEINIAQLMSGVSKDLILELEIPAMNVNVNDQQRNQIILKAILEAKDVKNNVFSKKFDLVVNFLNENEVLGDIEEDGEVMVNYYRVKAAEAMVYGMQSAENG